MEKKQNSVEYLVEQLFKTRNNSTEVKETNSESIIEKAKAMHKEERFQDFKEGFQAAVESLQGANNLVQSKKLGGNHE